MGFIPPLHVFCRCDRVRYTIPVSADEREFEDLRAPRFVIDLLLLSIGLDVRKLFEVFC
jgi:hypothetical protein